MKRAIFLLAVCAFVTVFAADEEYRREVERLRENSRRRTADIEETLRRQVETAINDAVANGVSPGALRECWDIFYSMRPDHYAIYSHSIPVPTGRRPARKNTIKYEEECTEDYIQLFVAIEKEYREKIMKCISKHVSAHSHTAEGRHPPILL